MKKGWNVINKAEKYFFYDSFADENSVDWFFFVDVSKIWYMTYAVQFRLPTLLFFCEIKWI